MEKRLVLFLVLSALLLVGHVLVRNMLFPPPASVAKSGDVEKKDEPAQAAGQDEEGSDLDPKPLKPDASPKQEAPEATDVEPDPDPPAEPDTPVAPPDTPRQEGPTKWFTLGSFDPEAGYRLLITLCNRGAAVERVELVERAEDGELAYRDLMSTHGYLGLYTHDTELGCEVKVVGAGTPAERAESLDEQSSEGLRVGDVVEAANGMDIATRADLEGFLTGTQPGDEVTLRVYRDGHPRVFSATVDHWPLQLIQPETPWSSLAREETPTGELVGASESSPKPYSVPSYLVGVHSVDESKRSRDQGELKGIPSLRRGIWKAVETKKNEIAFSRRFQLPDAMGGGELEFFKRYRLVPARDLEDVEPGDATANEVATGYYLRMELEIRNHGAAPRTVSYVMDGPNGLPVEGWWYTRKIHPSWGSAGARDVMWRVHGNEFRLRSATQIAEQLQDALEKKDVHSAVTSILTSNPTPAQRTLDYIGVDTQYFAAVTRAGTFPGPTAFTCRQAATVPVGELPDSGAFKKMNSSFRVVSVPEAINAGESMTDHFHVFLGPKSPEVLDACGLPDIIEYGWFGKIARPLSTVLQFFYRIFRNYGLAIVLLTVLVRGAMFPIGRKAARNAQVMQQLAPEIKKIKEKYKNDLQKQGEAQRELWKKHNFNPLSGCWLMFLQLPIFIGLYRCLSVDINLRQAPLIPGIQWCSNLAGPDMAWRWDGVMPGFLANETGWLGPYLNILPIFTIVLFLAQQKMFTPPATDDQTRMQQSMMKYMMIFIGVLFFKVPAGLCVYFIASSLWGIGERKLLPKPEVKPAATSKAGPRKKSWLERLREKAEADTTQAARKRRKRRR